MFAWTPEYWRGWREFANPYRRLKSERDRRLALDLLQLQEGDRVLEVGCGYGWITQALLSSGSIAWAGIDLSETMARELSTRLSAYRPNVSVADAYHLPFQSSEFDKILCNGVLMHLTDEAAALAEMVRVLRPDGLLVASMNNGLSPFSVPLRLHNASKKDFVQKFHFPSTYLKFLRSLGLQLRGVEGDGIFATAPLSLGRFSFPPKLVFPVVKRLDQWAVRQAPWFAYELWFAATKVERECAF